MGSPVCQTGLLMSGNPRSQTGSTRLRSIASTPRPARPAAARTTDRVARAAHQALSDRPPSCYQRELSLAGRLRLGDAQHRSNPSPGRHALRPPREADDARRVVAQLLVHTLLPRSSRRDQITAVAVRSRNTWIGVVIRSWDAAYAVRRPCTATLRPTCRSWVGPAQDLVGYATAHASELEVVGLRFSIERYGVGLRKGD
jgi:hypothetical protein